MKNFVKFISITVLVVAITVFFIIGFEKVNVGECEAIGLIFLGFFLVFFLYKIIEFFSRTGERIEKIKTQSAAIAFERQKRKKKADYENAMKVINMQEEAGNEEDNLDD